MVVTGTLDRLWCLETGNSGSSAGCVGDGCPRPAVVRQVVEGVDLVLPVCGHQFLSTGRLFPPPAISVAVQLLHAATGRVMCTLDRTCQVAG